MAASNLASLGAGGSASSIVLPAHWLSIPTAAYHVSTPSQASFVPGSNTLDLRAYVSMSTWVPAGNSFLLSKFGTGSEYAMYVDSAGKLSAVWTNPATVGQFCSCTVATGLAANASKWARALMNPVAGTCDFFLSDDDITYTPMGTQVTGKTTTGVVVGTASLRAGETDTGTGQWAAATAKIYRVKLLINSVLVSDMDFTIQTPGATNTTFTATTGETWTIANSAIIV